MGKVIIVDHKWEPQRVDIRTVQELADLQLRHAGVGTAHVRQLMAAMGSGRDVPPIKVARIDKALCVVDGFHRLAAAKQLGRGGIEALVAPMDLKAAKAEARLANIGHGKNLTPRDKGRILDSLIADGGHMDAHGEVLSSRAIAAAIGGVYSHTSIMRLLRRQGIEPNRGRDAAEGSKWSEGWGREGDDSDDDLGDLGGVGLGELDSANAAMIRGHLEAVGPLYFALGDHHKDATLAALRELLERLEANVEPEVPVEVELDI